MRIFLDDKREPPNCARYMHSIIYREEWIIVRSYSQFVRAVAVNIKLIAVVSLDYELRSGEKTGLDAAEWMLYYYRLKRRKLPIILVHSSHIEGSKAIKKLFSL